MTEDGPIGLSFKLTNTLDRDITVVVEPWAHEFDLASRRTFQLITSGADPSDSLAIELSEKAATIWVNTGVVTAAKIDGEDVWPYR